MVYIELRGGKSEIIFKESISVESCRFTNIAVFVLEKEAGEEEVVGVVKRSSRVDSFREEVELGQVDGEQPGTPLQYGRHHHQPLRAAVQLQLLQPEIYIKLHYQAYNNVIQHIQKVIQHKTQAFV